MAEDADHPDHLTSLADAVRDVTGVADELLATSHLQRERESDDSFLSPPGENARLNQPDVKPL